MEVEGLSQEILHTGKVFCESMERYAVNSNGEEIEKTLRTLTNLQRSSLHKRGIHIPVVNVIPEKGAQWLALDFNDQQMVTFLLLDKEVSRILECSHPPIVQHKPMAQQHRKDALEIISRGIRLTAITPLLVFTVRDT